MGCSHPTHRLLSRRWDPFVPVGTLFTQTSWYGGVGMYRMTDPDFNGHQRYLNQSLYLEDDEVEAI